MPVMQDNLAAAMCICMMQDPENTSTTHLNRTENPKYQRLHDNENCRSDTETKVHTNVLADVRVLAFLSVDLSPLFKPNAAACPKRQYIVPQYSRCSGRKVGLRGAA